MSVWEAFLVVIPIIGGLIFLLYSAIETHEDTIASCLVGFVMTALGCFWVGTSVAGEGRPEDVIRNGKYEVAACIRTRSRGKDMHDCLLREQDGQVTRYKFPASWERTSRQDAFPNGAKLVVYEHDGNQYVREDKTPVVGQTPARTPDGASEQ